MTKPLFETNEWTFPLLERILEECEIIGKEELQLDLYDNQIEVISSEQMLDAYASVAMPIMYQHWSWGKSFARNQHLYKKGLQGLAYEVVINSNPAISYLMEDNSAMMQTLVISHAAIGHNAVFRNNEFFRQWTDAEGILDYLVFARDYIAKCEDKYGLRAVEDILDSAHALQNLGVDRYRRPGKLSAVQEKERTDELFNNQQKEVNELWRTLPNESEKQSKETTSLLERQKSLKLPEENLLYFIEKKSPSLKQWQREIVRIVRKISQYFYPQRQTQTLNEGMAVFTHYYIMNRLFDKGLLTEGAMLEFLQSHANVLTQLSFDNKYYSGFNPYALGFSLYMDIKRICENPTQEDKEWFPDMAGKPWLPEIKYAMQNFRDESFIRQYLSPHLIREWRLFSINDDSNESHLTVDRIHNERGYKNIRTALADQYDLANRDPNIQVWDVDLLGSRHLCLRHFTRDNILLNKETPEVLKHVLRLWGYPVTLETVDPIQNKTYSTHKAEN